MSNEMISLSQMLEPAKSIKFVTSRFEGEPNTIVILFEDWKNSTVFYEEIKRVFADGDMSLSFEKIATKLKTTFIRNKHGYAEGHIIVAYSPHELEKFTKKVLPTGRYIVLFGSFDEGEIVITPGNKIDGREVIDFSGYKIL